MAAVMSPCNNCDSWDRHWHQLINSALTNKQLEKLRPIPNKLDTSHLHDYWKIADLIMRAGGACQAKYVLANFFEICRKDYHCLYSKPLQSQESYSRMSPYLAWSTMSLPEMLFHRKRIPYAI